MLLKRLIPSSGYEYGNYQQKFVDWLAARKKNKHIPIHSITRADVADYIEDLQHEGLKDSKRSIIGVLNREV